MTHEDYINQLRIKQVETANGILASQIEILEGIRRLVAIQRELGAPNDDDSLFLIGVESESDHLPIGNSRKYWNGAALKERDSEIRAFESTVRDQVLDICRRISVS